jgi:hypothetical protein
VILRFSPLPGTLAVALARLEVGSSRMPLTRWFCVGGRQQNKLHDQWRRRLHAVRQIRRHVDPGPGPSFDDFPSERQSGFATKDLQQGRSRRRVL